ncbi:MAG TPA: L-threonylcarbamoyladenylate synthase [Myxococcota bacterium]|nr:L-threonylcarbamoyladenylate synthase [Myxococcota bacterium]HRY95173.1 L-threonylcarbamoyladenylate synthase [Myxococcota bacterium]
MIIEINPRHPQPRLIRRVVEALARGAVISYPTDTIYGIGCDIFSKSGIERIYQLKDRSRKKPLSFICSDLKDISRYAQVSDNSYRLMRKYLPGPYTFILEATKEVPRIMMSKRRTVGIRVPDNPICLSLVRELMHPIITTSANVSEQDPLCDPKEIDAQFGKVLDLVIDGGALVNIPSTVIDLTGDQPYVVREGKGPVDWLAA